MVDHMLLRGPVCVSLPLLKLHNCSLFVAWRICNKILHTIVGNYMQSIIYVLCCGTKGTKNTAAEFCRRICANVIKNLACACQACTALVGQRFWNQTLVP